MVDPVDNVSLRAACDAMRTAIATRASGDVDKMRAPLRALVGLEQAAFNAPQNRGWLRQRQIELREALDGWPANPHRIAGADELQILYRDIVAVLQTQMPQPVFARRY
ncbi:MAG TPA: hypothetical protein VGZ02_11230 [Candidatus Baltobacteraceae bacterium]|jgi:hypothetical protein|nr:hypothetical protein [Candidatus Baltobacteraceae bacterium]